MPDSISIPLDLLTETRAALDAALCVAQDEPETYGKVVKVRAKLDEVMAGKYAKLAPNKQEGYNLLRRLDKLRREVREDYGIDR